MARVVRRICCGSLTSVESEENFSIGTDLITKKRNNLADNQVEITYFLSF